MCYIMGIFSPIRRANFGGLLDIAKKQLLLRGRDAVGVHYDASRVHRSQVMLLSKGDKGKAQLVKFLCGLPTGGRCLMLQTRATPGPEMIGHAEGVSLRDLQPFDKQHWVVSHNGTIANDQELRAGILGVDWQSESSVDSVVLPYLFADRGVYIATKKLLEGSFAIASYHKVGGRFYLAKNFQPLYYGIHDHVLYYSSLPTKLTPLEFPPYKLLCLDSGMEETWTDLYREVHNKSVLVACSSGLDSTTTLRLYQVLGYRVGVLFFNYGQQANAVERYCSQKICATLNIPWYEMTLPMEQFSSPLLEKEKPELDPLKDAESTFSYVPQRNLIMTAFALAMAEQMGYGSVALGMNLSDGGSYPDNGVPFLKKLGEVTPYSSNWQTRLEVVSPFVNLMKSEMLEVGIRIGVPFELVCSCYYPQVSDDGYPVYCDNCGSDVHYSNAWGKLGYIPPNIGFSDIDKSLMKFVPSIPDPEFRIKLRDLPYWEVIKETL